VFSKLGAPADPKDYDFADVKNGEEALDQPTQDFLRAQAAALHLNKTDAVKLAQAWVKQQNDGSVSQAAENTAKLAEEAKVLAANWGANAEINKFIAKKGAEALGLDAAAVDALEKVVGYAKTMEALRKVGELNGEAKFIGGGGMTKDGLMTKEQAVARKEELMKDTAWAKRYLDGGAAEGREMASLIALIVGSDEQ
jgi:hypothetical protein